MGVKCPSCRSENPDTVKFCGECGTPLPASKEHAPSATETFRAPIHELSTGTTFAGRYQIIEELGHGGMGRVYKVFDTDIKEKIALKLLRPEIALDKDTVERFSNELKLARKISHRNVCRMFDLGKAEGTSYITMEFVPGEDLKKLIRKTGQLGAGRAVSIAKQVCEGLAEAHHLGVIHRDLKPQNIMVDEEGNARIMDFGIARSLKGKGITGAGVMIGTPDYMSPEQVEGREADQRADIYSLGIVLYEMLTGRVPFEGDTPFAVGLKQKSEAPRDPRELNAQIPPDLDRLVLKCLEKDRAERYQSASDLHADLEKIERGLPTTRRVDVQRRPRASKEITVKFRPKRLIFPVLGLAALVVLAVLIFRPGMDKRKGDEGAPGLPSVAVLPFTDDSPQKGYDYLCEGIPGTLISALIRVQGLRVPARTSSFSFAGKGLDIQGIGRKLSVDHVLEGSIQVVGDDLRVTASLVKVEDGFQLWNETYDRRLQDVFAIQDEIARAIVRALKVRLLGGQADDLVSRGTNDLEAYRLYLQGLYHWNKRLGRDLNAAVGLFKQAIDRDPGYALAYVGLADSYSLLPLYADARPRDVFPLAKDAAKKALALDGRLAEAHNSLAYVYERFDLDWTGAEAEFKQALALNPNYATGHFWYGELLVLTGRPEAGIAEFQRALELDPVSLVINSNLGWAYLAARRYEQALDQLEKTLAMEPRFGSALVQIGYVYRFQRRYPEAIRVLRLAHEISGGNATVETALAGAYKADGQRDEAKRIVDELQARARTQYVPPLCLASLALILGDVDRAFDLAELSLEERDDGLIDLAQDPEWEPVRSDPRYKALRKRMGLDRPPL